MSPTVKEALAHAATRLARAGVSSAERDGELLLRHLLGWDRAKLLAEAETLLPPGLEEAFESLLKQRVKRRPLQHLTGIQAFWHHDFIVSRDVLIPRPETEVLVEAALGVLKSAFRPRIADVGTGSGCIALSLAAERRDAEVHGTDNSPRALAVAAENARRLQLAGRVAFHEADLLSPFLAEGRRFDLVASNPPYLDAAEREALAPEVRDHEPEAALFPPGDRYSVYRRLAPQARQALRPGGCLVVEIGLDMHSEVMRILREAGFKVENVLRDLQAIPRAVVASRLSP